MEMMSKRKTERKGIIKTILLTMAFIALLALPIYGADGSEALTAGKSLLANAAQVGGGLWAVWELVQLGMSIKDHNGPGIQGAIWQLVGGAIIIAAGTYIKGMDLTMSTDTPASATAALDYAKNIFMC